MQCLQLKICICLFSSGGGEKARERHVGRGKMLPRDRITGLLDAG